MPQLDTCFSKSYYYFFYKQKCLTYTYLHIYQSVFTWVCVCLRCAHWITHKLYEDTYPLTMLFNDCLSDSFCLGEHRSKSALVALLFFGKKLLIFHSLRMFCFHLLPFWSTNENGKQGVLSRLTSRFFSYPISII